MVTDYSSVAFDFAFLRKPVIYYQFDAELFDAPHADPQLELPGPVVATQGGILESLEEGGTGDVPEVEETLPTPTGISALEPIDENAPAKPRRRHPRGRR